MAYRTITLMGDPVRKESTAAAAITPGMLIERTSADKVQAHSSAGQNAEKMFALEDDLQGNEIGTAYSADNIVQIGFFKPGDEVYALLADGENAAIGDYLESNGSGYMRVYAASSAGAVEYPSSIVGVALEALDMSGSSGADPASQRIRIEIV